jgi:hypothetical protein
MSILPRWMYMQDRRDQTEDFGLGSQYVVQPALVLQSCGSDRTFTNKVDNDLPMSSATERGMKCSSISRLISHEPQKLRDSDLLGLYVGTQTARCCDKQVVSPVGSCLYRAAAPRPIHLLGALQWRAYRRMQSAATATRG